jgi:ABC-type polysaccharide/polyol phosphate transport system ATPase subunit
MGVGGLFKWLSPSMAESFSALQDVSFTIEPGESVGIIGANGSGKSTLLKILAGVTAPTAGEVNVYGRVASLLELGAGFHPMLTGRENVYLNAGMLGVRHKDTAKMFDSIVEFSGIGDFIDHPVDTYSSGMYVRLGFAVAVHVNPDIFLVDEVLAVGDEAFQRKCRDRIIELRNDGKTVLFVSHDLGIVNNLCDRVILLSKGKMIQRSTAQRTIEYYLRQVGATMGTHTIEQDGLEAIVSNGRVALFKDEEEATGPRGLQVSLQGLDQWYDSTTGVWEVYESGPDFCKAKGVMPRLAVTMYWDVRFEGGRLIWDFAIECQRDVQINHIDVNAFFPPEYGRWLYGDLEGDFPELMPSDAAWTTVVAPELSCYEAGALSLEGADRPPVAISMIPEKPFLRLQWSNTDYGTGSRVLQAGAHVPPGERTFAAGRHKIMRLAVDASTSEDALRTRFAQDRTLECGPLKVRFAQGTVSMSHNGNMLTSPLHLYGSMLIGHLWGDSHSLQWGDVKREGDQLQTVGESRRFPYRQHWELELTGDGLAVRIWLEALEALDVQEYQTSIILASAYDRWKTAQESGPFPESVEGKETWKHGNRNYEPGTWITALSSSLPYVTLKVTSDDAPFRMTAVSMGSFIGGHVLQALRTPGKGGMLHFEPGRHLFFQGLLSVSGENGAD